jgi:hypothetical protein
MVPGIEGQADKDGLLDPWVCRHYSVLKRQEPLTQQHSITSDDLKHLHHRWGNLIF